MRVRVSSKGQIVIPAEIRKRYDIKMGDELQLIDHAGRISLHPIPDDPIEAFRGAFKETGMTSEEFLAERRRERDREDRKVEMWRKRARS